jgi:hypothetical protein
MLLFRRKPAMPAITVEVYIRLLFVLIRDLGRSRKTSRAAYVDAQSLLAVACIWCDLSMFCIDIELVVRLS